MTAQYTPGPWTAHAPSEDLETRHWTIRAPGISPMVSFEVARISGRSETNPHTANLIAAAPELLEALQRAIEFVPAGYGIERQCWEAIAKAIGDAE